METLLMETPSLMETPIGFPKSLPLSRHPLPESALSPSPLPALSRVPPSSLRRQRMRRNFSYHERLKAVAEVQAGKPLRAVANAMGCTPSAISKWM